MFALKASGSLFSRFRFFAVTVCFIIAAIPSGAEVLLLAPSKIQISGPIEYQTSVEFHSLVSANPDVQTVELDSPGGLVYPALKIAERISAEGLNTWITSSSQCLSACSIVFLAGQLRLADGSLGVHQISGIRDTSVTQTVLSDVHAALTRFNTPQKLISIMLRTPPEDMYVFSPVELDELAINVRPGEEVYQQKPHLQVITSQVYKDWLVGTFLNTHTQQPFFAMESDAMNPVFRLVHYPDSSATFFEVIWDEPFQSAGTTDLRFRFHRDGSEPYTTWISVNADPNGFYADIPSDHKVGQAVHLFLLAFTRGHSLTISDFSGHKVASFSLAGTMRGAQRFTNLIQSAHTR